MLRIVESRDSKEEKTKVHGLETFFIGLPDVTVDLARDRPIRSSLPGDAARPSRRPGHDAPPLKNPFSERNEM